MWIASLGSLDCIVCGLYNVWIISCIDCGQKACMKCITWIIGLYGVWIVSCVDCGQKACGLHHLDHWIVSGMDCIVCRLYRVWIVSCMDCGQKACVDFNQYHQQKSYKIAVIKFSVQNSHVWIVSVASRIILENCKESRAPTCQVRDSFGAGPSCFPQWLSVQNLSIYKIQNILLQNKHIRY